MTRVPLLVIHHLLTLNHRSSFAIRQLDRYSLRLSHQPVDSDIDRVTLIVINHLLTLNHRALVAIRQLDRNQ